MPNGEEVPRPCSFLPYLFADIVVRTPQQLHEERHSAGIHHSLGLVRSATGNVGQGPGRLELKHCVVGVAKELNQPAEEQVCIICFLLSIQIQGGVGNLGKMPRLIITSIGGFRSLLRIFLAD